MFLLSACSLKLKTNEVKKEKYHSVGNEMKLFGFGIGENMRNIDEILGNPSESKENLDVFADKKLVVHYAYNISQYIETTNPDYKVLGKIKVGMFKDQLLEQFYDLDLFEYKKKDPGNSVIFFNRDNQKVVLNMGENQITKITVANNTVSLDELINGKSVLDEESKSDEEILKSSEFLTFNLDLDVNNNKALSNKFYDYLKLGLIEGVPIPIETSKNDLTRRFGEPNYVFEGKNDIKAFFYYKQYSLYLGIDETEKVRVIKMPVYLPIDTFKKAHDLKNLEPTEFGDFKIQYTIKDGNLTEIMMIKK